MANICAIGLDDESIVLVEVVVVVVGNTLLPTTGAVVFMLAVRESIIPPNVSPGCVGVAFNELLPRLRVDVEAVGATSLLAPTPCGIMNRSFTDNGLVFLAGPAESDTVGACTLLEPDSGGDCRLLVDDDDDDRLL